MDDSQTGISFPAEVVGVIASRAEFEAAAQGLLAAGFGHSDLSVLASHEPIEVAGRPATSWRDVLLAMLGEVRYEVPLVASGAVMIAGGAVAATVAALIGATVGGVAIRDVLQEVTAKPHTAEFARAVEAGSLILWVSVGDDQRLGQAVSILERHGAVNVHVARERSVAADA